MAKRERLDELRIVRAIAILGVLFVHSTSFITVDLSTGSFTYPFYNFLNIFFKYGTPTFIFLSSFVLFYNYKDRAIDKKMLVNFYKNRFLYVVVPYLVFSVLYFVLLENMYYHRPFGEAMIIFIQKVLTGKAYTHLYFVFISIQLYLLFPFVLYLAQKFKAFANYSIFIGLLIQWTFVLLNHFYFHITLKGSISLSYFAYYFLGVYLGFYFERYKAFLESKKHHIITVLWLGFSFFYVYITYLSRAKGVQFDSLVHEFAWNSATYFAALFLFGVSFIIKKKASEDIKKALYYLGDVSFGVYLVHPLILLVHRQFNVPPVGLIYHLYNMWGYLTALIFSVIIVELVTRYFKHSWMIFGTSKKPKKEKTQKNSEQKIEH